MAHQNAWLPIIHYPWPTSEMLKRDGPLFPVGHKCSLSLPGILGNFLKPPDPWTIGRNCFKLPLFLRENWMFTSPPFQHGVPYENCIPWLVVGGCGRALTKNMDCHWLIDTLPNPRRSDASFLCINCRWTHLITPSNGTEPSWTLCHCNHLDITKMVGQTWSIRRMLSNHDDE